MTRLWDTGEPLDRLVLRFTAEEDHRLDERLVPYDVRASIAHAAMLRDQGYLKAEEYEAVRKELEALAREHAEGRWRIQLEEEDVHTALERRLTARLGPVGGKIHLGRSRNDQVLAALRLYLKDAVSELAAASERAAAALEALGERYREVPLPGYTHLQQAMPSSVRLWAEGFAAQLRDDAEGLRAVRRRLDRNPLGSAAGYGVPVLQLDREKTRALLGFATTEEPVTAVQLARGKAEAQLLFEITLLLQDLGRLATDLLLFSTAEFGFASLPPELTTGSSIMPQKRNPDVLELIRAQGAAAAGALVEALALPAKLPSGYQRDLQALKAPLFRTVDRARLTLEIVAHTLPRVIFHPDRIRLLPDIHAAAEAYRLVVQEGLPFREAYRRVAQRRRR